MYAQHAKRRIFPQKNGIKLAQIGLENREIGNQVASHSFNAAAASLSVAAGRGTAPRTLPLASARAPPTRTVVLGHH